MKLLLLGGTGAIGNYLTEILSKNGNEIYVTSRKDNASSKVKYLKGNAHDDIFINNIFSLYGHFDCIVDFMSYKTSEFAIRVEKLLDHCNQYVFISTSRVYANAQDSISENTPRLLDTSNDRKFLKTDEYSLTKARQENLLVNSKRINWTIIRPYITYSANRFELCVHSKEDWLFRAIQGKSIVFADDIGKFYTTMTWGGDVANTLSKIIGNKSCLSKVYNITSGESCTWNEVLNVYCKCLTKHGYCPNVFHVKHDALFHSHDGKYQIMYDRCYNRRFETKSIERLVDVSQFEKLNDKLSECLSEFLKNPKFNNINWMLQGYYDRISKDNGKYSFDSGSINNKLKYIFGRYTPFFVWLEVFKSLIFPIYTKIKK